MLGWAKVLPDCSSRAEADGHRGLVDRSQEGSQQVRCSSGRGVIESLRNFWLRRWEEVRSCKASTLPGSSRFTEGHLGHHRAPQDRGPDLDHPGAGQVHSPFCVGRGWGFGFTSSWSAVSPDPGPGRRFCSPVSPACGRWRTRSPASPRLRLMDPLFEASSPVPAPFTPSKRFRYGTFTPSPVAFLLRCPSEKVLQS